MKSTRAIIIDDHECMRDMLRELLLNEGIIVVAETGEGDHAATLVLTHRPDWVFFDLNLPGFNGFEVANEVRDSGYKGLLLALTGDHRNYVFQRIHEAKFDGFFGKRANAREWQVGVRQILAGGSYYCPYFLQWRADQAKEAFAPAKLLTKRETEILCLIGLAWSDERIGESLGIASTTVQGVRTKLMHKLGLPNTGALVHFAQEHGYARFGSPTPIASKGETSHA